MRQYPAGPLCMRSHLLQWVDTNPYDITGAGGASSSSGSFQAPQFTKQHPGGGAAAITAVLVAAALFCAAATRSRAAAAVAVRVCVPLPDVLL